jgi:hypothetical protein
MDSRSTTSAPAQAARLERRDRQIALLIVAMGVLVQLPGLLWGVPDGKAINNALRILDGDVPYRDFWSMYAPGHFYLVALLFKVFGVHVWVDGIAKLTLIAVDAALLFVVTRRLGLARPASCLVSAAFVGMHWSFGPAVSSYETALAFLLPAIDRAIAYTQRASASALIVAGVLCGVGAWFKHDVSFYISLSIGGGLSLSWWLARGRRPDHWVSPIGVLTRVGVGALAGALPMVAFLALNAGPDAWRDLIAFPATDFRVVRGEAYPSLLPRWERLAPWFARPADPVQAYRAVEYVGEWMQANAPQVVFVAAVAALVLKRSALSMAAIAAACIVLVAMPIFWTSAHIQQNTNFWTLWTLSVLLGTIWLAAIQQPIWRTVIAGTFAVYTAALLIDTGLGVGQVAYFWKDHATLEFPSVKGVRVPQDRYEFLQPIVSFIREHVPESEPIYAGLVRHDAVVVSNQNFYFLSGRRVASRYNELHPGVVDREEVQREIIGDLEREHVRCAVLWNFGWPQPLLDSILAKRRRLIPELGSTLLDRYFTGNFQEVAGFGEYVLMWRKGIPMPPPPGAPPVRQVGSP